MLPALLRLCDISLTALRSLRLTLNRVTQKRIMQSANYLGTYETLAHYPDTDKARALLSEMANIAMNDPVYGRMFRAWLKKGSTLRFRELALPFGDYLRDRELRNLVNFIDSAHYYRTQDMEDTDLQSCSVG